MMPRSAFQSVALPMLFSAALAMQGCSEPEKPPTIADIRQAFSLHEQRRLPEDSVIFDEVPIVTFPDQVPDCSAEGDLHFDCSFQVLVSKNGKQSVEARRGHVWNDEGEWHLDSLD